MGDRILIFSLARCGSETLVSILNSHPEIRCVSEPFNSDNFEGQYRKRVQDAKSLYEAMDDLYKQYTAIKHVWDASGWPFSKMPQFNPLLLQAPHQKIIFLTRKNSLKRVVSLCIAGQTKRWGVFSDEDRASLAAFAFSPIQPQFVGWHLDGEKKLVPEYRKLLHDCKCEFMDLSYEQLFDPSHTSAQRTETITQIMAFLGKSGLQNAETQERMVGFLRTRQTAVDASLLYDRIPNIQEIEKQFGSPETGTLFGTSRMDSGATGKVLPSPANCAITTT